MVEHLVILSGAANYSGWMYRRIAPYLGQRILEVGAGIGNFTSLILDRELVVATDKFPKCVEYLQARHGAKLKAPPFQLDIENPGPELDDLQFDTVICLNVLAHVQDEMQALRYLASRLVADGCLIIIVPAFPFLYGRIDRVVNHYRRYTRKELAAKLVRAGFRVESTSYMNAVGTIGWFFLGRILRREVEPEAPINFADRFIVPLTERLERLVPPPFGLSIVAFARIQSTGWRAVQMAKTTRI
jgi:SAM-dependent methyltransferase